MTVSEFIDQLGGPSKVAQLFGVGRSAVSNWKKRQQLPPRLHHQAFRIAQSAGLDFDPAPADREAA